MLRNTLGLGWDPKEMHHEVAQRLLDQRIP